MLFGAERVVLYLEPPVRTLAALDGSREKHIRRSVEKFLSSPDSAFDKQIDRYLHQVRDLNTNTRAFTTWCQDESSNRELCVVHAIYRKRNEADYFALTSDYNQDGKEFDAQFEQLDETEYENWVENVESDENVIVVSSDR